MRTKNDCYTACLATLLNIPYKKVPRFFDNDNNLIDDWDTRLNNFLNNIGYQHLVFNTSLHMIKRIKGMCIVSGVSYTQEHRDKGHYHAVIYKDGSLYHDPKPNPEGEIIPDEIDLIFPIFKD